MIVKVLPQAQLQTLTIVIELDDEFSKHVELKMSPREFCRDRF